MGVWVWIILYVILFSLLQLLVYRYLRSDDDASLFQSTPPNGEPGSVEDVRDFEERHRFEERKRSNDPSVVVCPRCGAENETGYTYCRNCVSPMTAR